MDARTRKPRKGKRRFKESTVSGMVSSWAPKVIGEYSILEHHYSKSKILVYADRNRQRMPKGERAFEDILLDLNNGVLKGLYVKQYPTGNWIIDFFFPKIRLGVEIDGSGHLEPVQMEKDRRKDADCANLDITMIRFTNDEVFGERDPLVDKLRDGWRQALRRENKIIGKTERELRKQSIQGCASYP